MTQYAVKNKKTGEITHQSSSEWLVRKVIDKKNVARFTIVTRNDDESEWLPL